MPHSFREKFDGWPSITVAILLLFGVFGYGVYAYRSLEDDRILTLSELEASREEQYRLLQEIYAREEIIENFEGQISNIAGTVSVLDKLAKTDEELLKKYSKVYFLNENYSPSKLSEIPSQHLVNTATNFQIHTDVLPHLEDLMEAAEESGHDLLVASAYRSFQTQSALKSSYKVVYGSGANQFSADQGYSEHQLGTTVDFTTPALGANFNPFGGTEAYKWLLQNAHDYGFILSYPPNNAYYKFEPWHWRYVGVPLATYLHEAKRNFYDLDQREIDSYLIKLFN